MRLDVNENNGQLQFHLNHPTLGPSSRFTRCYGSSWLIRVKPSICILSRPEKVKELKKLLLRPLILNGQVFRFFYAKSLKKDISIFFMATNEHYDGNIKLQHSSSIGQRSYNSFLDFFSKHNNLQQNSHQVMYLYVKYFLALIILLDHCKMGSKNSFGPIKLCPWTDAG